MGWRRRTNVLVGVAAILITLLAIGMLSLQSYRYDREATDRSADYSGDAERQITRDCFRFSAASGDYAECVAKGEHAKRENERKEQDLAAQRVAAWWTTITGAAALAGVLLSAFGVFLVYRTFGAQRHANEIAADTVRRQLRAYVVFSDIEAIQFNPDKIPTFTFHFTNCGQTPALRLRVISNPFFYRTEKGEPPIRFEREEGAPFSTMTLAKDETHTLRDPQRRALTKDEIGFLESGAYGCIYAGVIWYRDIFGKRHMTTFKGKWTAETPNGPGNFRICERGNHAG